MILKPCLHCWKKECTIKDHKRKALLGSGITAASFSCKEYYVPFPPGTRVESVFVLHDIDDWGVTHPEDIAIQGTVMRHRNGKVQVWLDEPVDHGSIVKMWPCRLTILNEPQMPVCRYCGRPENQKNKDNWGCEICDMIPQSSVGPVARRG